MISLLHIITLPLLQDKTEVEKEKGKKEIIIPIASIKETVTNSIKEKPHYTKREYRQPTSLYHASGDKILRKRLRFVF